MVSASAWVPKGKPVKFIVLNQVVMMCSWSSLYSHCASPHFDLHSHVGAVEVLALPSECFADWYPVMKSYSIQSKK